MQMTFEISQLGQIQVIVFPKFFVGKVKKLPDEILLHEFCKYCIAVIFFVKVPNIKKFHNTPSMHIPNFSLYSLVPT